MVYPVRGQPQTPKSGARNLACVSHCFPFRWIASTADMLTQIIFRHMQSLNIRAYPIITVLTVTQRGKHARSRRRSHAKFII